MAYVFLEHPSSLEHDTGAYSSGAPGVAHPEHAERITAIERELSTRGWLGFERVRAPVVDRSVLRAVHPDLYVSAIEQVCRSGGTFLDVDTVVSERSFEAALYAVGGAVRMVDLLLDGAASVAFSSHRPPGHHALPSQAMGFCLFNNIAVAARAAQSRLGLERVAIVDFDVHHGNGTEAIFRDDDSVLFVSLHQWPFYPGSGGPDDQAETTLNVPMSAGSGDEEYVHAFEHTVEPAVARFEPELVLVSAGFDAHAEDPLADMRVTEGGFRELARRCASMAPRVAAVLEGGYELDTLPTLVEAALDGFTSA
jgi:acetoin utilization deacetylase AcuC-like enzyme